MIIGAITENLKTRDTVIGLNLIDPDSIQWYVDPVLDGTTGTIEMVTTNDLKVIVEQMEGDEAAKGYLTQEVFIDFISTEYAQRFAKAFKSAVTICGGKPSTF